MIQGPGWYGDDAEITDAALSALEAAKAANGLRNRVIHDMWLRDADAAPGTPWEAHRLIRGRVNPSLDPPRDLAYVDRALTAITTASWRVSMAAWAMAALVSQAPVGISREGSIAFKRDRFALLENGSARVI